MYLFFICLNVVSNLGCIEHLEDRCQKSIAVTLLIKYGARNLFKSNLSLSVPGQFNSVQV